jgi:LysR family nitrogen assimilation transcriptional regulator
MDLLELRYFVEIAEAGSLSRAAVRLGVSQPALTRQVRNLETELRVELFYRHGRGMSLTEAGRRLHAAGTEVLHKLHGVKQELLSSSNLVAGSISLGLPPSIAATIGARVAVTFADRYPEAQLHIRESFSGVLVEWVEGGRLDLAVLYDARRGPSMLVTPLLLEDLFLIVPPKEAFRRAGDAGGARVPPARAARSRERPAPGRGCRLPAGGGEAAHRHAA